MSTIFPPAADQSPSVSELVSGIVGDVQDLGVQHLTLFCNEIKQDIRTASDAALALAIGMAVAQIGGLLLCFTLVHLLVVLVPNCPIWLSFGLFGVLVTGLGGIAVYSGLKKLAKLDAHFDAATQAMKENTKCLTRTN